MRKRWNRRGKKVGGGLLGGKYAGKPAPSWAQPKRKFRISALARALPGAAGPEQVPGRELELVPLLR